MAKRGRAISADENDTARRIVSLCAFEPHVITGIGVMNCLATRGAHWVRQFVVGSYRLLSTPTEAVPMKWRASTVLGRGALRAP